MYLSHISQVKIITAMAIMTRIRFAIYLCGFIESKLVRGFEKCLVVGSGLVAFQIFLCRCIFHGCRGWIGLFDKGGSRV